MPEREVAIYPVRVDYVCDVCGRGYMLPTGSIILMTHPPKWPHKCDSCGDEKTFHDKYPFIRWKPNQ